MDAIIATLYSKGGPLFERIEKKILESVST